MKNSPSLIGVIHLPPLAGAPVAFGEDPSVSLQRAGSWAIQEAQVLAKAGFDGIILENFGDVPFYKTQVPPETIASLSVIAAAVRDVSRIPVGINVLRNDARAALAIASVTGCEFIRVNVLTGVAATDQGLVEGDAAFLIRERARLAAPVAVFADVDVKHAKSLSSDNSIDALKDLVGRGLADAAILTGKATGTPVDFAVLEQAAQVARSLGIPYYVGSGAKIADLPLIRQLGARVIVSSALRKGGRAGAPLDLKKVREFGKLFFKKPPQTRKSKPKTKGAKKGR